MGTNGPVRDYSVEDGPTFNYIAWAQLPTNTFRQLWSSFPNKIRLAIAFRRTSFFKTANVSAPCQACLDELSFAN